MKKTLIVAMIMLSICLASAEKCYNAYQQTVECKNVLPKPKVGWAYVTAYPYTVMRMLPYSESIVTGQVDNGELVRLLRYGKAYTKIKNSQGETGWVHSEDLTMTQYKPRN